MMKLQIGDLVYIKKEMPTCMSHFDKGKFAIITEIGMSNDYMTNISGWYPEDLLVLIKKNSNNKILKQLEICNDESEIEFEVIE